MIRESIMDLQGEWDPASNVPPESFGGGGGCLVRKTFVADSLSDTLTVVVGEETSNADAGADGANGNFSSVTDGELLIKAYGGGSGSGGAGTNNGGGGGGAQRSGDADSGAGGAGGAGKVWIWTVRFKQ